MKTMEKELVLEIFQAAEKAAEVAAAAGGSWCPEEERCVDALRRLRGVEIPREVMVNTEMGKRLSRLKNHPTERIKELCCDVINAMKSSLYRQHFPAKTGQPEKKKKKKKIRNHVKQQPSCMPVILALPALNSVSKKQQAKKS